MRRTKKSIKAAIAEIPKRPAKTPPTIAPVFDFELEGVPPDSFAELPEGLAPEDVMDEAADAVAEGTADRDDGEFALRQLVSSVLPTVTTSELPPCRPFESVIIHVMFVPADTSAIHSNEVEPVGALRMNVCPLGMTPYVGG